MQKILYIIMCMLLLTACERELGELTEYESPRLVINALITAKADSQLVHLRLTGLAHASYVSNAEVSICRNGEPFCQYTADGNPAYMLPPTNFDPGDQISIDVRSETSALGVRQGEHHVSATAEVPVPVIITGIDTLSVQAKRYKWSSEYERHTRYLVHLRLPEGVSADQMQYYRAEVIKNIYTVSSYAVVDNIISQVSVKTDDDHTQFGYWGDPALTETENADQENMSVSFDWLDGIENIYHVFRSNYFENGEYTLRLDLPEPRFYAPRLGMAQDVRIRIYAISRTEYNYLQALAAMRTLESGTLYDGEPGITTNVTGGAGIFCIESMTEVSFYEDRNLLKDGENYYDRN